MNDAHDYIHVGPEPIDPASGVEFVHSPEAGAITQFLGTVRNHNDGVGVVELAYESYREMAEAEIRRIVEDARGRWEIIKSHTVHRTGRLDVGAVSVSVTVSSAHREAGFAACRFIIDELKERAPIWKHETTTDGEARWVEPETADSPPDA